MQILEPHLIANSRPKDCLTSTLWMGETHSVLAKTKLPWSSLIHLPISTLFVTLKNVASTLHLYLPKSSFFHLWLLISKMMLLCRRTITTCLHILPTHEEVPAPLTNQLITMFFFCFFIFILWKCNFLDSTNTTPSLSFEQFMWIHPLYLYTQKWNLATLSPHTHQLCLSLSPLPSTILGCTKMVKKKCQLIINLSNLFLRSCTNICN